MSDELTEGARTTRRRFVAGAGALGAFACMPGIARAQNTPLRFNIFGGVDAWAFYAMREHGLLERAGYDVRVTTTTGSVPQMQHIMAGDADILLTAMDNIIAYDEGMGDPSVAGPVDLFGFLGVGPGFLRLVVRPEIMSYAQLRGKPLAVDAPATGFSFVLRRMLEKNGIMPGEYSFVALGSTQKRFDAMVSGQCFAGVVGTPYDLLGAQKYGFRILGSAVDVLGHYQANALAARRSWAATNRLAITAVVAAYRASVAWLYDPSNRAEAVAILARNTDLAPDLVAQIAPAIFASPTSFTRDGTFDAAGLKTTLELRTAYTTLPHPIGPASKYIDTSYL